MWNSCAPFPPLPEVDEIAHIDQPLRYHSIKWSHNFLERLELFKTLHVRIGRLEIRRLSAEVLIVGVDLLLGDRVGVNQLLVTLRGHARQSDVGLRLAEHGSRLVQLLIDFRSLDDGEQFPLRT